MSADNRNNLKEHGNTAAPAAPVTLEFAFGRYFGDVHPADPTLRHGQGTLSYKSGNIYKGGWENGAPSGVGEKQYANGDVFIGMWREGKRHGRGSYLYNEGHIFEGIYNDDQPSGYGILTTVEGDRYSGWWRKGLKDGSGVEILHEGQMMSGTWRNGMKEGPGKLSLPGAKGFIYGIWSKDRFVREMTAEERREWKAERQREREEETLDTPDGARPSLLPGESREEWDSEFEFNSSDEEREKQRGTEEGTAALNQLATNHLGTQQRIASVFAAASGSPGVVPEVAELSAMESRLEAFESALENALRGLNAT